MRVSGAVFLRICIVWLSVKWAKLGITLQRWDIMICVLHLWELRCCFTGERLASSFSLLASWVIKVRRFIPQYFGHEEDNSVSIGLEGKPQSDVLLSFMQARCLFRCARLAEGSRTNVIGFHDLDYSTERNLRRRASWVLCDHKTMAGHLYSPLHVIRASHISPPLVAKIKKKKNPSLTSL